MATILATDIDSRTGVFMTATNTPPQTSGHDDVARVVSGESASC